MTSRVSILLALCVLLGSVLADTIFLKGVLRDQAPAAMFNCGGNPGTANGGKGFTDTDFQISGYQDNEKGLAGVECNAGNNYRSCGKIGADRTPVYQFPGQSPLKNIGSPESFYKWFHDSPEAFNVFFDLPLAQIPNSASYNHKNDSFFPLDGRGWNDKCKNGAGVLHNYAYCFEAHSRFGYTGAEVFAFCGDDDVWVYINDQLVIDLGSLHTKLCKTINLKDIPGLVAGNTYRMDFFYCERHTTESNMEITTSLQFYCAYTDWCGVCEGTGQSCCTDDIIAKYCNDNNACTEDTCDTQKAPADGGCIHTPIKCPANPDKCTNSLCDPAKGCVLQKVQCDDSNPCTVDTCNPSVGCQFTPKSCDDKNICTDDSCGSTGQCLNVNTTATKCDDNNKCTNDACDPVSGCTRTAVNCNDNNKCTSDSCDPAKGCLNPVISCNDNNACTQDDCTPASGCSNVVLPCNPIDKCHSAACDAKSGCQQTNITSTCDDKNPCTIDTCDPVSGCINAPKDCDDGDICTNDACGADGTCTHTSVGPNCGVCGTKTCTFNDPCNPSVCDQATLTCKTVPKVCNDSNACTNDSCAASGNLATCVYKAFQCPQPDTCNPAVCDKIKGCGTAPVKCDDRNNCTIDSCVAGPTAATCKFVPVDCPTNDACNPASCDPLSGKCITTPVDCDDNNACTADLCVATSGKAVCQHTPKTCGNDCNPATCDTKTGACIEKPRTCTDQNPCTLDKVTCVNSTVPSCEYTLVEDPCNDSNVCTNDFCNATGTEADHCYHSPITCVPNICQENPMCDPINGCYFQNKTCPGATDFCLQGTCDLDAGCITVNRVCTVADPGCYVSVCNSNLSQCVESKRPDFSSSTSTTKNPGVLCALVYNPAVKKAAISAGVLAGIIIGAIIGAALIGIGGKAGYDFLQARSGAMGNVAQNPLYSAPASGGTSPLYAS